MDFEEVRDGFTGDGLEVIVNGSPCNGWACSGSGFQLYIKHNSMNFGEDSSLDRFMAIAKRR